MEGNENARRAETRAGGWKGELAGDRSGWASEGRAARIAGISQASVWTLSRRGLIRSRVSRGRNFYSVADLLAWRAAGKPLHRTDSEIGGAS